MHRFGIGGLRISKIIERGLGYFWSENKGFTYRLSKPTKRCGKTVQCRASGALNMYNIRTGGLWG